MPALTFIPPADFSHVVRFTPLVSIDLILRDPEGAVLVGLRTNEPAKGFWFVPGGRIGKDERLADAFARILGVETGLSIPISQARLLGAYEHFYDTNRFCEPGYGTHYVVLGYEMNLESRPDIALNEQHSRVQWMAVPELLAAPDVHENTKAYLR
jgi:colanic acid biosynthesis protein WcaH